VDSVRRGEHGQPYSSDYVLDEAVTATLVRTGRVAIAIKVGKLLLGSAEEKVPPLVRLLRVDEQAFGDAWKTFKSGKFERLSFTDHTILGQVRLLGIDSVASFDSGFDGLVTRVS
jgi:predicted nucleic acid-binding protein